MSMWQMRLAVFIQGLPWAGLFSLALGSVCLSGCTGKQDSQDLDGRFFGDACLGM